MESLVYNFTTMSSSSSEFDFILDLSAERVFFSSIYATKAMFIKCDRYSLFHSDKLKSDFIRLMSCWSELVVVPMTKKIVKYHTVPTIFKEILKKDIEQHLSNGNLTCGLHLYMLVKASNHLIKKIVDGVGPTTGKEIQEWLEVMKKIKEDKNKIFKSAGDKVKEEFCTMLQKYHELSSNISFDHVEEHPFFNHQMVFLHIAHLVYMYSKNVMDRTIPHKKNAKLCPTVQEMLLWENHCGRLCKVMFDLDSHGLLLLNSGLTRDKKFCNGINLPYSLYYVDRKLLSKDRLPSVSNMHKKVIEVFKNYCTNLCTSDIISQWEYESCVLHTYFQKSCEYIDVQKQKFSNRQKVQRSLMKKKKEGSYYCPKIPQEFWQRDIFLLGSYSMIPYTSNLQIIIKIEHNTKENPDEHVSDWDFDHSSESSSDSDEGEGENCGDNLGDIFEETELGNDDGSVGESRGEDGVSL